MKRSEHYERARVLLAPINDQLERHQRAGQPGRALTDGEREQLAVAQVHAILATAPRDVVGE